MASIVQADFDRLALLSTEGWDHNSHYHAFLLRQVPVNCARALDVGCGTGAFSRLLAPRCRQVLALDLSPEMVRVARQRSAALPNVEFRVADVTAVDLDAASYDFIVAIAAVHHLPLEAALRRFRAALAPGGVLAILDLYKAAGWGERLLSVAALPASLALQLVRTHRLRPPREVRRAWEEHGRHDRYSTLAEVRQVAGPLLPGCRVRRHLLWRFSLVWRRGAS